MASLVFHRDRESSDLPLVLLAPFPCDARVWARVLELVPGDVITVEPPGFGGSPVITDGQPSLEAYADAVAGGLAALGVERYVVAGNSMGGYVAMALAEREPAAIAGIGLLGTKSTADTPEAKQGRLDMAAAADAGTPASELVGPMRDKLLAEATRQADLPAVAALEQWLGEAPASGIAWAQRAMAARPDRTAALAQLAAGGAPGLVLHGGDDPLMGSEQQVIMAQALGVEAATVPGRGHLLPLEAPSETAEALRALWDRARTGE